MTIIGNGLIASSLKSCSADEIIFAAGVSDSACPDEREFEREIRLLFKALQECTRDDRRLVYFSSAGQIYGKIRGPRNEATPCTPTTRYGIHKHHCESLIHASGCKHMILRLPNLVGPTKNRSQLIPQLVQQALSGQATIMVQATRDLLGMDRLKSILAELLVNARKRETVVVASGVSISALQIFAEIQTILKCEPRVMEIEAGEPQEFKIGLLKSLAPLSTDFTPDYPRQVLHQFVPAIADQLCEK